MVRISERLFFEADSVCEEYPVECGKYRCGNHQPADQWHAFDLQDDCKIIGVADILIWP